MSAASASDFRDNLPGAFSKARISRKPTSTDWIPRCGRDFNGLSIVFGSLQVLLSAESNLGADGTILEQPVVTRQHPNHQPHAIDVGLGAGGLCQRGTVEALCVFRRAPHDLRGPFD